jgi:hypothetical protein
MSFFALFLSTIGTICVLYWWINPYKILTFNAGTGTLVETTVKSGGYLQVRENFCKKGDFTAIVSRMFIDGITYQVPVYTSNRAEGCSEQIEYVYIPKALPAGTYHIEADYSYKVNPIKTVHFKIKTENFIITK